MTKNEGLAHALLLSPKAHKKRRRKQTHTPLESCFAACLCFIFYFFQVSLSPFRCLAPRISFRQALGPWTPQYIDRPDTPVVDKGVTHTSGWSHTCADSPSTFNPIAKFVAPTLRPLMQLPAGAAAVSPVVSVATPVDQHPGAMRRVLFPGDRRSRPTSAERLAHLKKKKKLSRPRPRAYPPELSLVVEPPFFSFLFFPTYAQPPAPT